MSTANEQLIERFYAAFDARDGAAMAACYAPGAHFSDPVFPDLNGDEPGSDVADAHVAGERAADRAARARGRRRRGTAHWRAHYVFTQTGRPVVNDVRATFRFAGGLIAEHHDEFSFHRWSRQALGAPGLLLGWTPLLKASVRRRAAASLASFKQGGAQSSSAWRSLTLSLELGHHVGVAQRRHVAQLAALGDVAQQPPHDLARARLRQVVGPDDPLRPRELADPLRRRARGSRRSCSSSPSRPPSSVTNAVTDWPVSSSAWPITAASATLRVGDDRRLDLRGRHAVPGDVEHVVGAPDDPEVAVLVAPRGVADACRSRGRTSTSTSR